MTSITASPDSASGESKRWHVHPTKSATDLKQANGVKYSQFSEGKVAKIRMNNAQAATKLIADLIITEIPSVGAHGSPRLADLYLMNLGLACIYNLMAELYDRQLEQKSAQKIRTK